MPPHSSPAAMRRHWNVLCHEIGHRTAVLDRTIATSAALLDRIVHAPTLPFPRRIVASLAREVAATAKSVYRHPWSPDNFNYER